MKIHRLETKNLNSLYGSFTIDFDQHFKNVPLFLIHGPTGAGKSTLLDAICLALYGQTPRLSGSVTATGQESTKYIMSNGTVECASTLMFSLLSPCKTRRDYYRAEWSSRRAGRNKKAQMTGNFQAAHRSLLRVDKDNNPIGAPITSSHKPIDYDVHFEALLQKMDFPTFQRNVMLAQGQFSEFLKAKEEQKSEILEHLTNTDHYLAVGARAAARKKLADKKFADHQTRIGEIKLLSPEDIETLNVDLNSATTQLEVYDTQLKSNRQQIAWIDTFLTQVNEHQNATKDLAEQQTIYDQHTADFTRLERDNTCQPAAKHQQRVQEIQSECTKIDNELPVLRETLTTSDSAEQQAAKSVEQATKALIKTKKNLENAQPAIQNARKTYDALRISTQELNEATQQQKTAAATHQDKTTLHKTAAENLETATNNHVKATAQRTKLQSAEPIAENLIGWKARAQQLDKTRTERAARQTEIQNITTILDNHAAELKQKTRIYNTAEKEFEPLANAAQKAQDALNLMLHSNNSSDVSTLRELFARQYKTASDRKSLFERAQDAHTQLKNNLNAVQTLTLDRDALEQSLSPLKLQLESTEKDVQHTQKLIETLTLSRQDLLAILSFHDARQKLTDDTECPVCGSHEHPFKSAATPNQAEQDLQKRLDQTTQNHTDAQAALKTHQTLYNEAVRKLDNCHQNLKTTSERINTLNKDIERDTDHILQLLRQADVTETDNVHNWTTADFATHLNVITTAIEHAEQNTRQLQIAVDTRNETIESLQNARESSQELIKSINVLHTTIELQTAQHEALTQELIKLNDTIAEDENSLANSLKSCNIDVHKTDDKHKTYDITSAIAQAEKLKQAFDIASRAVVEHEKNLQNAKNTFFQAQTTLDAASKDLKSAQLNLNTRKTQQAKLEQEYKSLIKDFANKSPDDFEAELNTAIQAADKQLQTAQSAHADTRDALTTAKSMLDAKIAQQTNTTQKLASAKQQFIQILAELSIDEDTLNQYLLDPDTRKKLQETTNTLTKNLTTASTRQEVAQERLKNHNAIKPETITSLDNHDELAQISQNLTEQSTSLESERSDLSEQVGSIKQQLVASDRASQQHAKMMQELKALRHDAQKWTTIHDLIGVNNGKNFQRFAQSLNLGQLIRLANEWLNKLFPRYRLDALTTDKGEPTLNFSIIDRENADRQRPINTLSGGETFVISLALALALADFSRHRMPLETILIDEGFAALDGNTLDSVLNVLNTLQQQSGRQIGIISHVSGLKDRIDHRIHIEKRNKTQSTINVITGGHTTDAKSPDSVELT